MRKIIVLLVLCIGLFSCSVNTIDPYNNIKRERRYEPYAYDSISRPMKRHVYRIEYIDKKITNVINYE